MGLKKFGVILSIVFLKLALVIASANAWTITTIDGLNNSGQYSSIAVGTSGAAYISYYGSSTSGSLKYATNVSGSWGTSTIDNTTAADVGRYTSIAVGTQGAVHVSYYDVTGSNLMYAQKVSSSWGTSTIDSTTALDVGQHTSIAVGTSGAVYISYQEVTNKDLMYATNVSGSWGTTTIDTTGDSGQFSSIEVGSSGAAYIGYYYYTQGNLKYATNVSGSWATSNADADGNDVGRYCSLAVGTSGAAYMSYYNANTLDLWYTTNVSGSWVRSTIDTITAADVGQYTSLAVGTSSVYISYYDATNGNLMYATNVSGSWGTSTLDSAGDVGQYTSIALSASGTAHISYYDATNADLKYAEVLNRASTASTGAASSITTSSATLAGTVNADGDSDVAWFDYGVTSGSYTGSSTTQSVSGTSSTSVSIGLSGLSSGTTYYYRIKTRSVAGYSNGSEASFSTSSSGGGGEPVKEKLTISSTSPSSGATGVSVTTAVYATFNMYVNGATVTTETFKLSDENGDVSGSVVTNGATITFTPSLSLSYGTKYTATVTTKVSAANAAGTTMESAYSWDFTTESLIAVTPTPAASPSPTPAVTATPAVTPKATVTPTPTAAPSPTATATLPPKPSPTVTAAPTLPPKPTPPPVPTPTVSVAPTPVATATPAECTAASMSLSSYNLRLKMQKSKGVIVTVTGSNGCLVEGGVVAAKMVGSAGRYVSISPRRATTNADGQARFKIKARKTKGNATVSFTCEEIEETVTVKVVK